MESTLLSVDGFPPDAFNGIEPSDLKLNAVIVALFERLGLHEGDTLMVQRQNGTVEALPKLPLKKISVAESRRLLTAHWQVPQAAAEGSHDGL